MAYPVACPAENSVVTILQTLARALHFAALYGTDRMTTTEGEKTMTTLAILGGVLGVAGVLAAFFRTRSSRKAGSLHLGVGTSVRQILDREGRRQCARLPNAR